MNKSKYNFSNSDFRNSVFNIESTVTHHVSEISGADNNMEISAITDDISKVKSHIGQNELRQAFDLMDKQITTYLRANNPELYNELVIHKQTYTNVIYEERQGLLTREQVKVELAQFAKRLLQFLDSISKELK